MAFQAAKAFTLKYPITRGMLTYATLWPVANLTEQYFVGDEKWDVKQIIRFGLFGSFVVAPSLYVWVRLSSKLIKGQSLIIGVKKAAIEQLVYSPYAVSSFLIGMGLLEGQDWDHISAEWQQKFIPTWKTGACYWPIVQTINFAFMKERNRVPFTAAFSFLWTVFLSYVKRQEVEKKKSGSK